VIDSPFRGSFGGTRGEALFQLIAPSGKVSVEKRSTSDSSYSDNSIRPKVSAGGEAGRYELRVFLRGVSAADTGSTFTRAPTDLGNVVYDAAGRISLLGGPGRLWFRVPGGRGQFTPSFSAFVGGGMALRGPDHERVAGSQPARPSPACTCRQIGWRWMIGRGTRANGGA
jgi:hypothetical protein